MSYILDALKKAERERDVGVVPTLGAVHDSTEPAAVLNWSWIVAGTLAIALIVVIAIVPWGEPSQPEKDLGSPRAVAGPAAPPSPMASAPKATVPGGTSAAATYVAPSADTRADTVPSWTATGSSSAVQPATVAAAKKESVQPLTTLVPSSKPKVSAAAATSVQGGSEVAGRRVDATRGGAVAALDDPSEQTTPRNFESLPLLYEMSPAFQNAVPDFRMDVHVYSDNAKRSFVIMNGRKYRESEDLGRGALLEAITPEGAVIVFRDERFRLLY